jgi:alkanesulfonate monooxygenase SsuD/methylene tetrahydromethanopterin reductase-like flavin-dependent oxidoreductase (luciferase family)
MKFSNFIFPAAESPDDDGRVIRESVAEAQLCDRLGVDTVWLAEHHFDGICAYVDPVAFAAALATCTEKVKIGFAVAQMSLHHPVRFAEQMNLIDHLSKGRLIVGLGRGTAYNIYDYQGYDIDPNEAQERLLESEEIMLKAWTTENYEHKGKFWHIKLPKLRPVPYTKPHPTILRASSTENSMVGLAKEGRPFMMNVQSDEVTQHRMDLYRATLAEAGYDDGIIAKNVDQSWVWRNIFVAETDAEAERIGVPAFQRQHEFRAEMRERVYKEQGVRLQEEKTGIARNSPAHGLIYGSPATVAERLAKIDKIGVGGMMMAFRLGPMAGEIANTSIKLFMEKVAPEFQNQTAAAAAE